MSRRIPNRTSSCTFVLVSVVLLTTIAIAKHHLQRPTEMPNTNTVKPSGPSEKMKVTSSTEERLPSFTITDGIFAPSLEQKENVDFLLTPGLLVQEAIKSDVVITYPSE